MIALLLMRVLGLEPLMEDAELAASHCEAGTSRRDCLVLAIDALPEVPRAGRWLILAVTPR